MSVEQVTVKVKALGDTAVVFDLGAIERIESRTGKTVGEIMSKIAEISAGSKAAKAPGADASEEGLKVLRGLPLSLIINFVGAVLNIDADRVSTTLKLNEPWEIFQEVLPAFVAAANGFMGIESPEDDNPPADAASSGGDSEPD